MPTAEVKKPLPALGLGEREDEKTKSCKRSTIGPQKKGERRRREEIPRRMVGCPRNGHKGGSGNKRRFQPAKSGIGTEMAPPGEKKRTNGPSLMASEEVQHRGGAEALRKSYIH